MLTGAIRAAAWAGLLAAGLTGGGALAAAPRAEDLVRAELIAEPSAVAAGQEFTVGIRFTVKEHWHTYWRNPGDSGLATEVKWTLPEGAVAGELIWPVPARIPVSHLVNYGYEGETVLLSRITAPGSLLPGRPFEIKALVNYLVCERECIPGEVNLSLTLPTAGASNSSTVDPDNEGLFENARAQLPTPAPWPTRIEENGDGLRVRVEAAGLRADSIQSAYFFPVQETAIEHAAPQPMSVGKEGLTLDLKRGNLGRVSAQDVGGVLVIEEALEGGTTRHAFEIGKIAAAPAGVVMSGASLGSAPVVRAVDLSPAAVVQAAFLALLGGLILNLMPCVFPVLSIKVLSLVKHSSYGPRLVRLNGVAYAAGVIASFLALAGLLLALRAAGSEIGWGFQLQSPLVVAGLAFLLFGMGLSLSGVMALGTSLGGLGSRLTGRSGLPGSFLTGVLATVVASPCTAPFMGAAIGYGLTAPAAVTVAVFAALGLGMALPFLVLTFSPGLARRLPRPGAWMETLKQVLAFPLYATVAWLIFVTAQQVGPTGLFASLIGLVLVGFAAWCLRIASLGSRWGRRSGQIGAVAALLALAAVALVIDRDRGSASPGATAAAGEWEPFTQARLDALRAEGRPVFVNMTAAWCITCVVNEKTALSAGPVRDVFRTRNIAYLKGDWTNQNPEITRLLEQHGRSGVPLYLLYRGQAEAIVLPQILTQASMLETLARLGEPRRADLRIRTTTE